MPEYLVTVAYRIDVPSGDTAAAMAADWCCGSGEVLSVEPVVEPLDEQSPDFQRTMRDTIDTLGQFTESGARIEWARETLDTLAPVACKNTDYGIMRACQHYLETCRRQDLGSGFGKY